MRCFVNVVVQGTKCQIDLPSLAAFAFCASMRRFLHFWTSSSFVRSFRLFLFETEEEATEPASERADGDIERLDEDILLFFFASYLIKLLDHLV